MKQKIRMNNKSQYCPNCMNKKGLVKWIKEGCLNSCPNKDTFKLATYENGEVKFDEL